MSLRFFVAILVILAFTSCDNTDSNSSPYFIGFNGSSSVIIGGVALDDSATAAGEVTEDAELEFVIYAADDGLGQFGDNIVGTSFTAEIGPVTRSSTGIGYLIELEVDEGTEVSGDVVEVNTPRVDGVVGIIRQLKLTITINGIDTSFGTGETLTFDIILRDGDGAAVRQTFVLQVDMASAI